MIQFRPIYNPDFTVIDEARLLHIIQADRFNVIRLAEQPLTLRLCIGTWVHGFAQFDSDLSLCVFLAAHYPNLLAVYGDPVEPERTTVHWLNPKPSI